MIKRIIGAILILLISIPLIIIGGQYFIFACGLLGAFALKECIDLKKHHQTIPNGIIVLSTCVLLFLIFASYYSFSLDYKSISFLLIVLFVPCLFYQEKNYSTHEAIYLSGCSLLLGMFFHNLIFIRFYNLWILVYLLCISVFTDTFALFIGKLIGKHKCSPTISPNKTWEGCIGGTIVGVILSTMFYMYKIGNASIIKVVMITCILSIIGQLGDLIFSKIKRENEIKDFSNIIIGHGGILDRFDSLMFIVLGYLLFFGMI